MGEQPRIWIERHERLSRSLLWGLQRAFFEQQGIQAWSRGTVPHYVTSNTFIADAYARVVLGFLRDCLGPDGPPAAGRPIYIVEVGSGSGRFAFHFLKAFRRMLGGSSLHRAPIVYVMTDFAQRSIDGYRAHPALQPFVEQGLLDFAVFDAESTEQIALAVSGGTLAPGTVQEPLIFFANYLFDSLPQDVFTLTNGALHEALISLSSEREEPDLKDPGLLQRVKVDYEERPTSADYYADPDLDAILRYYQQHLASTAILFPCAALRCIRRLRRLAGGPLLLLSGDKGYIREEALLNRPKPGLVLHGSFSLMVNYHAIARYFAAQGGQALYTRRQHAALNVCAFLAGAAPGGYAETALAYSQAMGGFSPDEFFIFYKLIEKHSTLLTLEEILACLRLSGWDATIFFRCYPTLLERVGAASEQAQEEILWAVRQIWDTYFHIGEERDLAFALGRVLFRLKNYPEALQYFQRSLQLHGPDARTMFNIALCQSNLRQLEAAQEAVERALCLDPAFDAAKALRIRIQGRLSGAS